MKFKYKVKSKITSQQKDKIAKDIVQANKDYRETNSKINKKCTGFMMRKLTKLPFLQQIAMNSEYFKNTDVIKGIDYPDGHVVIEVDDMLVEDIKFAESLGAAKLNVTLNYMRRLFGMTIEEGKYTLKGFNKYLTDSLKVHGVEVDGS